MRHTFLIAPLAAVLLLSGNARGITLLRSPQPSAQVKLQQAEQLADRFARRFAATLNFEIVYREMFVRDPTLRRRNAEGVLNGLAVKQLSDQVDDATKDKLFVSFMNTLYLGFLYEMNVKDAFKKEPVQYLPRELMRVVKRSGLYKCAYFENDCSAHEIKTQKELRQIISMGRRLSVVLRRHIPRNAIGSKTYQANVKELVWSGRASSVSQGDSFFAIDERVPVYEVARGIFLFQIIEEAGEFKVLTLIFAN
jgi:hypothetical protein